MEEYADIVELRERRIRGLAEMGYPRRHALAVMVKMAGVAEEDFVDRAVAALADLSFLRPMLWFAEVGSLLPALGGRDFVHLRAVCREWRQPLTDALCKGVGAEALRAAEAAAAAAVAARAEAEAEAAVEAAPVASTSRALLRRPWGRYLAAVVTKFCPPS